MLGKEAKNFMMLSKIRCSIKKIGAIDEACSKPFLTELLNIVAYLHSNKNIL